MSLFDGSAVLQQLCADYPSYSPGGTIVHDCVIHGSLGLMSLHQLASASLSDGSAVLQQLFADYPSYSPGGTTVHRHVNINK